jgi:dipeptidyl aminopeptidase/acylaminoacyl peptidase
VTGTAGDSVLHPAGWLDYGWRTVLSRDGRQLAISDASTESGPNYAVLLRSDTGARTARLGEGWPEQFSKDGKWVLSVVPTTPSRLMLYPTGPGAERQIPIGAIQTIDHAEWMPDEQSVLICGNERGKSARCVQQSLDGKEIRAMPDMTSRRTVGNDLLLSPNGDLMLTSRGADRQMASLADGVVRAIPGLDARDHISRWAPDGRALWVVKSGGEDLERLDVFTGARSMVLPQMRIAPGQNGVRSVALADEPRTFAAVLLSAESDLFVVEGAMGKARPAKP